MNNSLISQGKAWRVRMAMLATVVLIAPGAVSRASAVSPDPTNHVAVSDSTVSSWSPAASWSTGNDPQNCGTLVFPANSDIYHWVVQSQNGNNGLTGKNRKSWTYSADFTSGGSVDVEFMDGSKATYSRQTFNLSSIQENHLWTALPSGSHVKNAWLNYNVAVSGDTASAPVITSLTTNHNLSHSCASPLPTVTIDSATPSYKESWEERYKWDLDKTLNLTEEETAKEKFFDVAKNPEFKVKATRSSSTEKSGWTIVDGTQKVSGSFTLTNARKADATISLTGATCTTADDLNKTDLTFNYECVWSTESTVTGADGLKNVPFTVDASVTNSSGTATASTTGKFGDQSADSASSGTYATTASLTDDLADLGGKVISCTGCSASVTDGVLAIGPTTGSFTVIYSVDWTWSQFESKGKCTAAFTNTAELTVPSSPSDTNPTKISKSFETNPSCPPPTVTLKNISSSYDVSYDNTYSWEITKKFESQDEETLNAKYTVTAKRSGPTVSNVKVVDGSATITGEFTTTYANVSNVIVSVSYDGKEFGCTEDQEDGTFECTITNLETSDEVDGLKGDSYEVTASVETGGGSDSDSSEEEFDAPDTSSPNNIHASARVVDDLGEYAALSIVCDIEGSDKSCWTASSTSLPAESTLTTDYATSTITLTYELDWLASADTSEDCPSITNTAEIVDGESSLDDATVTSDMTCPEPVITLDTSPNPTYDQSWTESYGWELTKSFKGQDTASWKPIYEVTAKRGSSTVDSNSYAVVDTSQKVEGTFTIAMSPNVMEADISNTDVTLTMNGAVCTIGDPDGSLVYPFSCVITDEGSVTGANGLNGVEFKVEAKAKAFGTEDTDSVTDEWGNQTSGSASKYNNASGRVVDNLAAFNGGVVTSANATVANKVLASDWTSNTITVQYLGNWDYSAQGACGQSLTNTADVTASVDGPSLATASITNTMKCLTALPGLTIGFWGNKQGGSEVVAKKSQWRTSGPWTTVLGTLPSFTNDAAVRDYMNKANCSGDCKTMFMAQALASAMNTLRNSEYQGQWVKFQGVCTKVQTLLTTALGGTSILNGPVNTRIAYKSIFDDLNNSRATRCPGV